jgi:hypothetical protein
MGTTHIAVEPIEVLAVLVSLAGGGGDRLLTRELRVAQDCRETGVQVGREETPQRDRAGVDVSAAVARVVNEDVLDASLLQLREPGEEGRRDAVDVGGEVRAVGGLKLLEVEDADFRVGNELENVEGGDVSEGGDFAMVRKETKKR